MKLLFIYNANSGVLNSLLDSAHKILSPATYDCKLCDLTFDVATENKVWKTFRQKSNIEMVFLHKDEFLKQYKSKWLPKFEFPIVLEVTSESLEVLIAPQEMEQFETVERFITLIEDQTNR